MLKSILVFASILLLSFNIKAQEATQNTLTLVGELPSSINESSGIEFTSGLLFTHNDSKNTAEVFVVDTASMKILQTIKVDNYPNIDWEDITSDADYIYIGDTGNNSGDRKDLRVLKIAKSDFLDKGNTVHVKAEAISYSYTDQTNFSPNDFTNFDCEAIIAMGANLYLFTKNHIDLQTRVYRLPKTSGTYSLDPYTSFNIMGEITGADYNPELKEVALVGYQIGKLNPFIYLLNDFEGDHFFSGNKRRIAIGANGSLQTEGITYDDKNTIFISCEKNDGIPASLFTFDVVTISTAIFASNNSDKDLKSYPNPSNGKLIVKHKELIRSVEIKNTMGTTVFTSEVNDYFIELDIRQLNQPNGSYILFVSTAGNRNYSMPVIFQ